MDLTEWVLTVIGIYLIVLALSHAVNYSHVFR